MIDIIKLYQQYSIPYQIAGHKHVRHGWVGIPCPYCVGNPGYHLGYCYEQNSKYAGRFFCWRCGGKKLLKVISTLLSVDEQSAYSIVKKFQINGTGPLLPQEGIKKGPSQGVSVCKFPAGTGPLKEVHRNYLLSRSFDPSKIESLWEIYATGPAGDYNHRIIIPIYFDGKLVSYQGRDITGRSEMKYKACSQDKEVREHKHCLYGLDLVKRDSVVVVEGVTDVWRLGPGAVATFGIKFKQAQVRLLSKFKQVFILFDSEEQAQEQARLLALSLTNHDRTVEIIELSGGDPGEMSQEDADQLMKELLT